MLHSMSRGSGALVCLGTLGMLAWTACGIAAKAPGVSTDNVGSPVSMEGKRMLAYELVLARGEAWPRTGSTQPQSLCVFDDASGALLARFEGADLVSRIVPVRPLPAASGKPVSAMDTTAIFIEFSLASSQQPRILRHRFGCAANGTVVAKGDVEPVRTIDQTQPPRLGPPLGAGTWVAVHQPDWAKGHRRVFYADGSTTYLPGRYAIDFVGIDEAGRTTHGDADKPADAIGYGAPVLAVATARVAKVRDGVPESGSIRHNPPHGPEKASGNYVMLALPDGRFAVYEHLKPGSITVKAGQTVRRGQVIGALGFSGDTTGPHLHFHVADRASMLEAEGQPFAFERFSLLGHMDIANLGKQPWSPLAADLDANRRAEWPAYNAVIVFE